MIGLRQSIRFLSRSCMSARPCATTSTWSPTCWSVSRDGANVTRPSASVPRRVIACADDSLGLLKDAPACVLVLAAAGMLAALRSCSPPMAGICQIRNVAIYRKAARKNTASRSPRHQITRYSAAMPAVTQGFSQRHSLRNVANMPQ